MESVRIGGLVYKPSLTTTSPLIATVIVATATDVDMGKLKLLLIFRYVITHQRCVTGYDRTTDLLRALITPITRSIIDMAIDAIINVVNGEVS